MLAAEGFDFAGYALRENVSDIDAVRQPLGVRQIPLRHLIRLAMGAGRVAPVIINGQTINGPAIGYTLYTAQYDPCALAAIPQAMDQTARGQVRGLLLSGQSFDFVRGVSSSHAVGKPVANGHAPLDGAVAADLAKFVLRSAAPA